MLLHNISLNVSDPTELAVLHNARTWSDTESALLFRLRAYHDPLVDDERGIGAFGLLKLQSFWIHPDAPISRMSMREIADTVSGLEWLLLSDGICTPTEDRTPEWFAEFAEALELARHRVFYLVQHETNKEILDVRNDSDLTWVESVVEDGGEPEFDYDSDGETRMANRVILRDEEITRMIDLPHRVTDDFVMDMDAAFRGMDDAMFTRWWWRNERSEEDTEKFDLRDLRRRVFEEFAQLKEETCVTSRREWIQDLLVVPSYVQVHTRRFPHDKRPTSRSVLVKKHETLAKLSTPSSVGDIVTPPPKTDGRRGTIEMRINTDAALAYVSGSVSNDDFVKKAWVGSLDWRSPPPSGKPGIVRLLAEQRWLVYAPGEDGRKFKSWSADSLAAAVCVYREYVDSGFAKRVFS